MRLPRVRFTVRLMTIGAAVTVALVVFAVGIVWLRNPFQVSLGRLHTIYIDKATHHAELEQKFERLTRYQDFNKSHGSMIQGGHYTHILNPQLPELVPKYLELVKYHGSLREKYERAALNPRLPVAPDPPSPPEPQ